MDDSTPVEVSLDDFEKDFFAPSGTDAPQPEAEAEADEVVEAPEQVEEDSELTPSATENESEESEVEETEDDVGEDAPAETDEDTEAEESEETPKKKGRKPARERIRELTREKHELERRLAALESERSQEKPEKSVNSSAPESDAPQPDAVGEDGEALYPLGEFDPRFIQDLVKYTNAQERAEAKRQAEAERIQEEATKAQQELVSNWEEKVEAAIEELPDLPAKFEELQETFADVDPNYGDYLASTIMSLEHGPFILDYLADNLEEAVDIIAAGPLQATLALGKLEARFENQRKKSEVEKGKVRPTKAPPPPPRTTGKAKSVDLNNLDAFEREFFKR